jgi:hypothetical protein
MIEPLAADPRFEIGDGVSVEADLKATWPDAVLPGRPLRRSACRALWAWTTWFGCLAACGMPAPLPAADPVARTTDDWRAQVPDIRRRMEEVMGPLPGDDRRVPLAVEVVSEQATAGYVRRKIRYTPEAGDRVPAWLLIPTVTARGGRPAMLCLHQTTSVGKDEPAGLAGLDSLHYAHELAARGYVCLVPDYPSFGEYVYDFTTPDRGYRSGSMKAVWNNIRGVDLLASMPEVDPRRIGAIGHSLGGHNAIFTAAFDERIVATVSSCGFTPFPDYYKGDVKGWTSPRYMPRIRDAYGLDAARIPFDFPEVIAGLCPRGFFASAPVDDGNFDVGGVRRAFALARPVYDLFTATDRLTLVTPDGRHGFPEAARNEAYGWLDRLIGHVPADEDPR